VFDGFRTFVMRGNVVDLAVGVVIGAAFGAVVTAFVKDLITPIIGALIGKPNFSTLGFTINHAHFALGDFINALVSFVLIAAAVYYVVVFPMAAIERRRAPAAEPPATRECPYCLETVPAAATKCRACTSSLA
jgi:large conductance mechanosensitive channel